MNILRRRYDVILKLTVMLALIGCFFIAGGKNVKADPEVDETPTADAAGNIKFTVKDGAEGWKLGCYWTNNPTSSLQTIKEIDVSSAAASDNDYTVTAAEILRSFAEQTDIPTRTSHIAKIYYALYNAGTPTSINTTVNTKEIYKFDTATVTGANTTVSAYNNRAAKATDDKVYGYVDGQAKYVAVITDDSAYAVGGWTCTPKDGTGTDFTDAEYRNNTLIFPVSSVTFNNDYTCNPIIKNIVREIKLTPDGGTAAKSFTVKSGVMSGYTVTIDPAGAMGITTLTTDKVIIEKIQGGDCYYNYSVSGGTGTLSVKPDSGTTGDVVLKISIRDGKGVGNNYSENFTFTACKPLTDISISGIPTDKVIYKDQPITFTATLNSGAEAQPASYKWYINGTEVTGATGATYQYTPTTVGATVKVQVKAKDNLTPHTEISSLESTLTVRDNKLTKLEFGETSYGVTVGYTVSTTAKATPTAALVSDDVVFSSSSDATATIASSSENETTGIATAVVKGVKAGDATLTAKGKTNTTITATTKITVYSSPTDTAAFKYTESSRTLKAALPEKVMVGNATYDIDKVTGYKIYVMKGSEELGTITYKDKGTTGESSASDLESIIKDKVGKFSGDTDTIKLRAVAMGTYNNSSDVREAKDDKGNLLAWETEVKVYKVSVSGNGINGAQTYGLAGQKVSLTATPAAGYTSVKWANGSTNNTRDDITVSTSTANNQLKAEGVLGANTNTPAGSGGEGYDEVPKTSESNMPFLFIIFSVFAVIGTGYALYMTLRPARTTDPTDDYDE